jgi:hypothetical protein
LTRSLGTDSQEFAMRACAGRPIQEPGGQMVCPRRLWPRPGLRRRDVGAGRSSVGWPPVAAGTALMPEAGGGMAGWCRPHRLLADAWQLSLSRSYTGYHRAGDPLANLVPRAAFS